MGRNAIAVPADVSNLQQVQSLVKTSADKLGPLNTMVANAGIAQVKPLLELTEEDLKRMFEVNGNSAPTCIYTYKDAYTYTSILFSPILTNPPQSTASSTPTPPPPNK